MSNNFLKKFLHKGHPPAEAMAIILPAPLTAPSHPPNPNSSPNPTRTLYLTPTLTLTLTYYDISACLVQLH